MMTNGSQVSNFQNKGNSKRLQSFSDKPPRTFFFLTDNQFFYFPFLSSTSLFYLFSSFFLQQINTNKKQFNFLQRFYLRFSHLVFFLIPLGT